MPPDPIADALAAKRAASARFSSRQTDVGLGDELATAKSAPKPEPVPEPRYEPAQGGKGEGVTIDDDGTIHAHPGAKTAKDAPKNEIDYRAWRAKGRNAPIHTKVRPEFRKMFYQGAAREEKELCVVLEEMILARYGRKK